VSIKEPECKDCNGVFGKIVKNGLCSHCYHQAEEEAYVNDSIQYDLAKQEAGWPEDHDEREE
jgi:hypothetical protein